MSDREPAIGEATDGACVLASAWKRAESADRTIVADFFEATGLDHRIDRRCATPYRENLK